MCLVDTLASTPLHHTAKLLQHLQSTPTMWSDAQMISFAPPNSMVLPSAGCATAVAVEQFQADKVSRMQTLSSSYLRCQHNHVAQQQVHTR